MRFFLTLFLFCLLAAAQAQCLTANATSQNATANSTSPVPIRANRAAEVSGNITNVPILTPFPSLTLNASQIGCPEENGVCSVVDFKFLACLTQRHLLSSEEASKCPSNATFPNITANATVQWSIPITYRCYNKSTHSCVNGYFLCPANASSLCGVQCYSPSNYTCYTTYSLCPQEAPYKCGESCFSPDHFSCENGTLVSANSNSTAGSNSSSGEMAFAELNVYALPMQPAARRLSVLRRREY